MNNSDTNMKPIGYYPGCSLSGTAIEYNKSLTGIAPLLGFDLVEVPDWNCCGASSAHALNRKLSLALPARVLAIAEHEGMDRVLVPCAACYNRMVKTQVEAEENENLKQEISAIIEMPFLAKAKPVSIIEFFSEMDSETITSLVTKPLEELKVACYYGCLLLRPPKLIKFDDCEAPQVMENLVAATGAEPVEWEFKTECCGAGFSISKKEVVIDLTEKILRNAKSEGADVIIVGCPLCHANLDLRQVDILKKNKDIHIPVLYITELVGIALGLTPKEVGMTDHFIDTSSVAV
jgi:heterodisulfide reductase subunit B